jgi:hypothetical protein
VFPLFTETVSEVEYLLSTEALAEESITVEEVSESGSVPDLIVENKGDARVLFLEGEVLIGAKQNRILNLSVLLAAHSTTKIPVSCVEQGRWAYRSRTFGPSGMSSPSKLRHALKESVAESLQSGRGYQSDQLKVWKNIAKLHERLQVESETAAMSDAYVAYNDRIADYQCQLPYVDGAVGMAVAVGDRVAGIELFDKATTCAKVWGRMISGYVVDALEAGETTTTIDVNAVEQLLTRAASCNWEAAVPVGEGTDYRAALPHGDHASALVFEQTVVHGCVVVARS